jgi:hypothetical protein
MAKYYINKFNEPNTDKWDFAIWEIKVDLTRGPWGGGSSQWYKFVKKIYDPKDHFREGFQLDPADHLIANDAKSLIWKLFEFDKPVLR